MLGMWWAQRRLYPIPVREVDFGEHLDAAKAGCSNSLYVIGLAAQKAYDALPGPGAHAAPGTPPLPASLHAGVQGRTTVWGPAREVQTGLVKSQGF